MSYIKTKQSSQNPLIIFSTVFRLKAVECAIVMCEWLFRLDETSNNHKEATQDIQKARFVRRFSFEAKGAGPRSSLHSFPFELI